MNQESINLELNERHKVGSFLSKAKTPDDWTEDGEPEDVG